MIWPPWRRGAADRAEWFRRGHDAGAAQARAQLAGIRNLHRPITVPDPPRPGLPICRTCGGRHPCPTYQLAGGPTNGTE